MKKIFFVAFIILSGVIDLRAQTASTYFPAATGHKWFFKNEVLDTLNNPVDSLTTFTIDSFATTITYKEKEANVVLSKTGPEATVLFQPYLDTGYVNLSGNDGNVYFSPADLNGLLSLIDTTGFDTTLGGIGNLLNTLASFEKWYAFYKFSNIVNVSYTIFSYDTTISFDTLTLPLRFDVTNRRLSDGTLATPIGTFTCKKFLPQYRISYRVVLPPPLPPLLVPLLTVRDTIYIAPGNWIVQSTIPSTVLDLSYLELPTFSLPGFKVSSIPEILPPVSVDENYREVSGLSVTNYPNPSSGDTRIVFNLPGSSASGKYDRVTIRLYDLLGNEVALIMDELKVPGTYETELTNFNTVDGFTLSSGVYFYRLTYGDASVTKKLVVVR
ncbi:MAG: T9SS type A sorting domain-containing protein [Ignavibacteriaceae bacterium]|nr:T9SS type A sorting domain-containing protein [Ignavibacteriaceae bacterium]